MTFITMQCTKFEELFAKIDKINGHTVLHLTDLICKFVKIVKFNV